MTQIDKAIEYLKNAADQDEYIEPVDMLRDIFGIERKLVYEYHFVDDKKEIKVGDKVKVIGPSLAGRLDMMGHIVEIYDIYTTNSGQKEFSTKNCRAFLESSLGLV